MSETCICDTCRYEPDPHENERFIKLPLDADGVPIHIGDYLESKELGGKRFPCRGLNVEVCGGGKRWTVCASYDSYSGTSEYVSSNSCIHVKLRTPEDMAHNDLAKECDRQRKRIVELEGPYAKVKKENGQLRKELEMEREDNASIRRLFDAVAPRCGKPDCPSLVEYVEKLRELVRDMWCWLLAPTVGGATLHDLQGRMDELGIEE